MPQLPYAITILGPRGIFPDKRKSLCYYYSGDKRNIETTAIGDTKKCVLEVFQGLAKTLA